MVESATTVVGDTPRVGFGFSVSSLLFVAGRWAWFLEWRRDFQVRCELRLGLGKIRDDDLNMRIRESGT